MELRSIAVAEREECYRASTAVSTDVSLLETSSEEEESSAIAQKKPEPLTSALPQSDRGEQSLYSYSLCCTSSRSHQNQQLKSLSCFICSRCIKSICRTSFALQQLSTEYNRDDYKELLELIPGTQRHFRARIGWHCDLCDQDVAF